RAIPPKDSSGTPLPGANTTFADGTAFRPDGDLARSSNWAWRPFGNVTILSSLGPSYSTPPTNTRELATTITNPKQGAQSPDGQCSGRQRPEPILSRRDGEVGSEGFLLGHSSPARPPWLLGRAAFTAAQGRVQPRRPVPVPLRGFHGCGMTIQE